MNTKTPPTVRSCNIGVFGATGMAGRQVVKIVHEREFRHTSIRLFASKGSVGQIIEMGDQKLVVEHVEPENVWKLDLDLAFLAVDSDKSKNLTPALLAAGTTVIDKSSAYRMDPKVPLVIPEINRNLLLGRPQLVTNPNCSTAIALMALWPLHLRFGLLNCFISTYQSVSGSGAKGVQDLVGQPEKPFYPHPIASNVIPHIDRFGRDGYTGEETKMYEEMRKITGLSDLRVSATCVRVPVVRGHSMVINAEFHAHVTVDEARKAIAGFPGAVLIDDPEMNEYPMPLHSIGQERVAVGRFRLDNVFTNGLAFFVAGDNLWRGAALNAILNAETLLSL